MATMSAHALGMLQFALKYPGEWHSYDIKDRKTRNAVNRLLTLGLIERPSATSTQYRLAGNAKPVEPVGTFGQWALAAVQAKPFTEDTMRGECWNDLTRGVRLIQTGIDKFTVVYGKQVHADLCYADAASALGRGLMHSLSCDGMLDNREPRTKRDLRASTFSARFANPEAS